MTPNELVQILKEYNFKKNSVRSFSLKYKITEKTIDRFPMTSYSQRTDSDFVQFELKTELNAATVSLRNVNKIFTC